MSLPRPAVRGATHLVTRRCSERRFFLQPTALVAQVFAYVLAIAAERTGVIVHAVCVMANHHHAVVTETATLRLAPPRQLDDSGDRGVALMSSHLAAREQQLRDAARADGKKFVGLRNVLAQKWWESPTSFAKRRGLHPRIASRDKWRRIEAIARDRQFAADHADARREWLAGNRDVVWPAGTYLMRVRHNVTCAPPPT